MSVAHSSDPVQKPHSWDKAVSASYLRLLGGTQEGVAESVGIGVRTLIRWEKCSWWPQVEAEATSRWLAGLRGKAMGALDDLVDIREPATVRFVAERAIPEMAPPKIRQEVTGEDGGPIRFEELTKAELQERKAHLANRIAALQQGQNGKPNGAG